VQALHVLPSIASIFVDMKFLLAEIVTARRELHDLLQMSLKPAERAVLHKQLSVLWFASDQQQDLFSVAD
jgi:hypothetical protein